MLWVHEPRVPGTYHWVTGMYNVIGVTHRIDETGYSTDLRLNRKIPDSADQMIKYTMMTDQSKHVWGKHT